MPDPRPVELEVRRVCGLVDADTAAALLCVPKSWLMAEARRDRVPHVRFGRYSRFDPDQLQAWWRSQQRGPSAPPAGHGPAPGDPHAPVGAGRAVSGAGRGPRRGPRGVV